MDVLLDVALHPCAKLRRVLLAPAREGRVATELLLHMNSDIWGGGGAFINASYKLIKRNSVSDSIVYNAGREKLDTPCSMQDLADYLNLRRKVRIFFPLSPLPVNPIPLPFRLLSSSASFSLAGFNECAR